MNEACAECKTPMVLGHLISIDNGRRTWRLCCLCAATLIQRLDAPLAEAKSGE